MTVPPVPSTPFISTGSIKHYGAAAATMVRIMELDGDEMQGEGHKFQGAGYRVQVTG